MKPTPEQIAEVQRHRQVEQDWCDGKTTQRRPINVYPIVWSDALSLGQDSWDWTLEDYRTKPEPPTVWAADLNTEYPSFCVKYDPHVHAVRDWKKYTLHEVLP